MGLGMLKGWRRVVVVGMGVRGVGMEEGGKEKKWELGREFMMLMLFMIGGFW